MLWTAILRAPRDHDHFAHPVQPVGEDHHVGGLRRSAGAARAQRNAGFTGTITITIRAGTYYLPETLVLGPEDSDTLWQAAPHEHPVISGRRPITGWQVGLPSNPETGEKAKPSAREI